MGARGGAPLTSPFTPPMMMPNMPTPEGRARNEVDHMPHAASCRSCCGGEGQADGRFINTSDDSVVRGAACDCCFMGDTGEGTWKRPIRGFRCRVRCTVLEHITHSRTQPNRVCTSMRQPTGETCHRLEKQSCACAWPQFADQGHMMIPGTLEPTSGLWKRATCHWLERLEVCS